MPAVTEERIAVIDSLVEAYIEKIKLDNALEAARLGASREAIDFIIKASLERNVPDIAKEAAKLRGEALTTEEIDSSVVACLNKGGLHDALNLAKLGASSKAIDSIIEAGRHKEGWFSEILEVANLLGTSPEALDLLTEVCVNEGQPSFAQKVASLRGRDLTTEEIDSLMETCLEEGFLVGAKEAAALRGRDLTIEEIERLLQTV